MERTPTACCSLAAVSINAACVGDEVDSASVHVTSEPHSHFLKYVAKVNVRTIKTYCFFMSLTHIVPHSPEHEKGSSRVVLVFKHVWIVF